MSHAGRKLQIGNSQSLVFRSKLSMMGADAGVWEISNSVVVDFCDRLRAGLMPHGFVLFAGSKGAVGDLFSIEADRFFDGRRRHT
jgi:hypothetical protein